MKKFSIRYKFLAILLAIAFIFQSLESINSHTYSVKGISVDLGRTCNNPILPHLTYYCNDFHNY